MMHKSLLRVALTLAAVYACDPAGDAVSFKPTENEKYTLSELEIRGEVAKTVIKEYSPEDSTKVAATTTLVFNKAGRVLRQDSKDLLSGVKTSYVFGYYSDGTLKGIKYRSGGTRAEMRYTYDKRNRTRECNTISGGKKTLTEMVWYDQDGYPIKILSATEPEKYWVYTYSPDGKMLNKASYVNDGSGTLILNYYHSAFVGNTWTREVSQDDQGNSYARTTKVLNNYGDMEESHSESQGGEIKVHVKIQYAYDVSGNWTDMVHTSSVNDGDVSTIHKTRVITYR